MKKTLNTNSQRIHIRGQMGVQLLQSAVGLATLNDNKDPIICVNTSGLAYDASSKLDVITNVKFRVINIPTMFKTPYWVSGAASDIFTTREKVLNWICLKEYKLQKNLITGIHVRGKDKKVASTKSIAYMIGEAIKQDKSAKIFTNDLSMIDPVTLSSLEEGIRPYGQAADIVDDWFSLYHSDVVYAAPSAFIFSMLIFNPDKKIIFLSDKHCDGSYTNIANDLLFINEAKNYCKNVSFLE